MKPKDAIVLYPAPGMGHIVSMVELGKLILQRYSDEFSITILLTTGFWDTPNITAYIHSISETDPSITFRRFPFVSIDTAPSRSPLAICFDFIRLHAPNARLSLQEISKTCNIRAFIIDIFCSSALSVGKELQIPTLYFYTSGAAALAAFLQFPKIHQQTTKSLKGLTDTVFDFQGLPSLKATEMPEPMLDREDPSYHDFICFCSSLPKSDGIIANTFDDLEPIAINAIADGVCVADEPTPPTYYVGPLIARREAEHECLLWLNRQPSRSVVFLCFGSRGSFTVAQLKEIANGIERTGQRFLWVVKNPPYDEKRKQTEYTTEVDFDALLPEGFLERVKDRGMVVKSWAPQVAVLNRESVGGFVTHCGWNSVLEAVVAGVPMIAWPLHAEQHLNRNVLVEDMKMAIAVEQRGEDGFVSSSQLEMRVRELMESEKGRELKERSSRMREKALATHTDSGASTKALDKLVEAWMQG